MIQNVERIHANSEDPGITQDRDWERTRDGEIEAIEARAHERVPPKISLRGSVRELKRSSVQYALTSGHGSFSGVDQGWIDEIRTLIVTTRGDREWKTRMDSQKLRHAPVP